MVKNGRQFYVACRLKCTSYQCDLVPFQKLFYGQREETRIVHKRTRLPYAKEMADSGL